MAVKEQRIGPASFASFVGIPFVDAQAVCRGAGSGPMIMLAGGAHQRRDIGRTASTDSPDGDAVPFHRLFLDLLWGRTDT